MVADDERNQRRRSGTSGVTLTLLAGGFAVVAIVAALALSTMLGGPSERDLEVERLALVQRLADLRSDYARTVALAIAELAADGENRLDDLRAVLDSRPASRKEALRGSSFHRVVIAMDAMGDELGRFRVKLISPRPRSGAGEPVRIERNALDTFVRNPELLELARLDQDSGLFRYFRPVRMTESCIACHGDPSLSVEFWGRDDGKDCTGAAMEGWIGGEIIGAVEVVQPIGRR